MVLMRLWRILGSKNEGRVKFTFFILLVISLLEFTGLILVIPYVNIMMGTENSSLYLAHMLFFIESLNLTGNIKIDASILFAVFYLLKNVALMGLVFFQHTLLKKIQAFPLHSHLKWNIKIAIKSTC